MREKLRILSITSVIVRVLTLTFSSLLKICAGIGREIRRIILEQYMRKAVEGAQGCTQVMRYRAGERFELLILRLHLQGPFGDTLFGFFVEPFDLLSRLFLLGDMAADREILSVRPAGCMPAAPRYHVVSYEIETDSATEDSYRSDQFASEHGFPLAILAGEGFSPSPGRERLFLRSTVLRAPETTESVMLQKTREFSSVEPLAPSGASYAVLYENGW